MITFTSDTYQTPPIDAFVVSDPLNDLWRQVLWRATERECSLFWVSGVDSLFAQAEICDFQVAIVVEEYIFRLQVSVDHTVLVQTADGFNELGRIEACPSLWELGLLAQMEKQFTAI